MHQAPGVMHAYACKADEKIRITVNEVQLQCKQSGCNLWPSRHMAIEKSAVAWKRQLHAMHGRDIARGEPLSPTMYPPLGAPSLQLG